jgi:hypothetical protein
MKSHPANIFFAVAVLVATSRTPARADAPKSVFPKPRQVAISEEKKPHIGVNLGTNDPGGGYNSAFGYGLEAGYQPYIPLGLGAELYRFQSSHDTHSRLNLDRTQLLLKGTYNFGGDIPVIKNAYVGGQLGPVLDTIAGASYLRMGMGLLAGADFFVGGSPKKDQWSVGAVANYLWVSDSDADYFGVNGVVKYWF